MIRIEIEDTRDGKKYAREVADGQVVLGKAPDSTIVLPRTNVSRRHTAIEMRDGRVVVQDLGSTNGTFVNGVRLTGPVSLGPQDQIELGDFRLRAYPVEAKPKPATQAPPPAPPAPPQPAPTPAEPRPTPAVTPPPQPKPAPPEPPAAQKQEGVGEESARDKMYQETLRGFLKPVLHYLDDESVSELMINGAYDIFVERGGKIVKIPETFSSEDAVLIVIRNLAQYVGRPISEERPYLDARLPDGSRVAAMIRPCSRIGPSLSIRKFKKSSIDIDKLVEWGSLTHNAAHLVRACVLMHKNIMVSGGTGSGKTSLLNVVSGLIPAHERIIVIEDSSELQLHQDHVLPWETRAADEKGRGEVSIRDLVRASLRFRPDRIVVGEIRAGEAIDLLQAMNTGHDGSMSTVHASTPRQTLARLETLVLFAGLDMPIVAVRAQIASALDVILQTARLRDGSRKITHISEVLELDDRGDYRTQDIFRFVQESVDEDGTIHGSLDPTGILPTFADQFTSHGIHLPEDCFTPPQKGPPA